jgi:hypothetical protein
VDCEEVTSCRITSCNDEVGTNVALIAEEMLLEHRHDGDDTWFAASGEGMELEVGGDEGGGEFGVCGCSGAGAPYLGRDVVEFFTVLGIENIVLARTVRYVLHV